MPDNETDALREARRIMEICNACRYCGGFCAVFPAMEKRRAFSAGDLEYLANLCHDCRGCFHACQYAPPHEFHLNNPKVMARLRAQTYKTHAWPASLSVLFDANGFSVFLIAGLSVAAALLMTFLFAGAGTFLAVHRGAGAFYRVIPYRIMVWGALALALFSLAALGAGLVRFVRAMGPDPACPVRFRHLVAALRDVLILRYLGGAGDGCNDVDETFTHLRRGLHLSVFYGFLCCLLSTTLAACYAHLMHRAAPYALSSLPVVTGTVGGLGLMVGTGGLFWLKVWGDPRPTEPRLLGMDAAFTALLFFVSLSGLLLLLVRQTAAMGGFLAAHLGLVAAFFLVLPYGKFIHALYRFAALVRFAAQGPYQMDD